jgi:hypothetical protein
MLLQSWLYEYFTSRDVTMNEVLIIKQAPGQAMFYYTRDALRDVQLQLVSTDTVMCVQVLDVLPSWQCQLNLSICCTWLSALL